jgi:hypothetical protein
MSPDQHRTVSPEENAAGASAAVRHSAFDEFKRDERRPAVLLLSALVIAAVFFALGIMLGRWMTQQADASPANTNTTTTSRPTPNIVGQPSPARSVEPTP